MPTLTERLVRLRQEMTCCRLTTTNSGASLEQVERDGWTSVHADDVLALVAIAEAAREYVQSCRLTEALVAVRAPNPEAGASSEETWQLFDLLEALIGGSDAR